MMVSCTFCERIYMYKRSCLCFRSWVNINSFNLIILSKLGCHEQWLFFVKIENFMASIYIKCFIFFDPMYNISKIARSRSFILKCRSFLIFKLHSIIFFKKLWHQQTLNISIIKVVLWNCLGYHIVQVFTSTKFSRWDRI